MTFKELVKLDGGDVLLRFTTKGVFERFIVLDSELAKVVHKALTQYLEENKHETE